MKIELNRESLVKKLTIAGNVIPQKSMIPVLDNALFNFKDGRLSITAADLDVSVITSMEYTLNEGEETDFICDSNIILKTITTLKAESIWIELKEKSLSFGSSGTRKKYEIPIYYDPSTFPTIKSEFLETVKVSGEMFSQGVKITSPIVNKSDLRTGLTGVFMGKVGDKFRISSATALFFAIFEFPVDFDFPQILVSKDTLKVIADFEKSADISLSVSKDKSYLLIDNGEVKSYCRLIDSVFPNIDAIISQVNRTEFVKIDRLECSSCVTRSTLFNNRESKSIKLDFSSKNNIVISAENIDYAKRASESIDYIERSAEMDFETGMNADLLQTALRSLDGDNIIINQNTFKTPLIISDDKDRVSNMYFLVSPIILNKKD
jgi:DNA polymerase-3 subunit beta